MFIICLYVLMRMTDPFTAMPEPAHVSVRRDDSLLSVPLNRQVRLDIVLPPNYDPRQVYPLLLLNDGQDLARLHLTQTLDTLYRQQRIRPFILIAIHAGDRIQEYGTAARADYMGRGSRAGRYTDFVLTELMPWLRARYRISTNRADHVIAGFSLGGLSAFDIAFHHPAQFGRAGVFSGSFWWRSRALADGYNDDTDRIMQTLVRLGTADPKQYLWFQAGTLDETDDRNHNGVIDSIDDTLDLLYELEKKGVNRNQQVHYVQVEGGQHNPETWAAIMPQFLEWAFGQK
jgi:enterochelin esterase-like enzyme